MILVSGERLFYAVRRHWFKWSVIEVVGYKNPPLGTTVREYLISEHWRQKDAIKALGSLNG